MEDMGGVARGGKEGVIPEGGAPQEVCRCAPIEAGVNMLIYSIQLG